MSSLYIATTVLSVVIVYLYTYFKRKHSFWKDKGVPTPRVLPIVGHALDLTLAPFYDVMARNTKECGKTYGTYQVTRPILMTSDPEIIKNVTIRDSHIFLNHQDFSDVFGDVGKRFLLNLRDEEWRRMRNIMSPAFTSGKMKGMFPVIRNCANNSLVALEDYVDEDVDLRKFFSRYSVDVIASTCFAFNVDCYDRTKSNAFIDNVGLVFKPNFFSFALYATLPGSIFRALKLQVFPLSAMQYFERIVQKAIRERRANQIKAHDFLQLLIDIWDDDAALDPKSKMITEAELIPQAIAFLSAGHDTTTVWLAVTFYLLALNPDCQQRLHEELNSITDLDYDKLTDNQYLDAVVHESLRMYSPATLLGRLASDDYLIPGTDITIPKGTEVQIPIWSVHYDPDNYTDPGKFDPMRFMPENKDRLKPCTFLPFGSGIRNCIGQRFSFLETKVAVAEMIMNFEFFKTDKTPLKPVFKGGSGQLDFDPLYVGVRARQ